MRTSLKMILFLDGSRFFSNVHETKLNKTKTRRERERERETQNATKAKRQ